MRQVLRILAPIFTLLAAPAASQDVQYVLVDSGVLSHPEHGKGIEMRVTAGVLPDDGFYGETNQLAMPHICKHYAPSIIPFLAEKLGMIEPAFIAVRLTSSQLFIDRYMLEFFTVENGTCGDKL
jgi:hypothetical protein